MLRPIAKVLRPITCVRSVGAAQIGRKSVGASVHSYMERSVEPCGKYRLPWNLDIPSLPPYFTLLTLRYNRSFTRATPGTLRMYRTKLMKICEIVLFESSSCTPKILNEFTKRLRSYDLNFHWFCMYSYGKRRSWQIKQMKICWRNGTNHLIFFVRIVYGWMEISAEFQMFSLHRFKEINYNLRKLWIQGIFTAKSLANNAWKMLSRSENKTPTVVRVT